MTMNEGKKLVLIDGSSYLYRAFHALPPLNNSRGEPTGAIYGVINMLKKTVSDHKPDYMAVIFDAKGKNFRHEIYPEYKANRPPMDEDLKIQIEPLYEIIKAMGVPLLSITGVEADDVIGTLARDAEKSGVNILISTSDKDMAQLVNKNITLVNTMSNTVMDIAGVEAKFGVRPEQIIDYLSLVGDASDNISGVSGVGPKTAVKWLKEYNSLENIIESKDKIRGKVGESFRLSLGQLPSVKELVTIKNDVDLDSNFEDLIIKKSDNKVLAELFTKLEFKTWLSDINRSVENKSSSSSKSRYHLILTKKDFEFWLDKLKNAHSFAFDTETTSLDVIQAEIVGISFAMNIGESIYIPFAHSYDGAPDQLSCDYVLEKLKPIFADPKKIKLAQNIKYDISVLANYGVEVSGVGYDTMLESYTLNSIASRHDKGTLVLKYLGRTITNYEDLVGKGAKQIPFSNLELEKAAPYAAFDSDLVLQLHQVMWPQIEEIKKQADFFKQIEMPLVRVLSKMERFGVCIDSEFLSRYSTELKEQTKKLEQQIYTEAGLEFNISSPAQLQKVLYEDLKLPILKKTPKGQPSTAEPVLQDLASNYVLPELILKYRSLTKLVSTYTDALPKQINSKTGRVHTSYNQAVTATGRLSSTDPNLQNIPIRTAEGRKVRKAFIAPEGCKIISADYSQIELRVMAHLSQDENLVKAFQQNSDVHRMVAAEIFDVSLEDVTDTQRRYAKTINFGLIYGMSAFGLAKRIGMSRKEAEAYIELYFSRYPGVKKYMDDMKEFAHTNGFVETIFGRRLYIPDIKSKNFMRRAAAERAAINAPMQGTAADIIKIAMVNIDKWICGCDFKISMIMQVHDELVFEVEESRIDFALDGIKSCMESAANLSVPMLADIGVGDNWDEAH